MELFTPEKDDIAFCQNLSTTVAGEKLFQHIINVDTVHRHHGQVGSAVHEVASHRRTLCYGLSKDSRCFGLPDPLPPYIAITNLSGSRNLYYSHNPGLIRLLCMTGQDMAQKVTQNVQEVLEFAHERKCSVMVCLSLPWQAGFNQSFWELRTVRRNSDGSVRDGERCFCVGFEDGVRTVMSSNECMNEHVDVLVKQVEAFKLHYATTCVDVPTESIDVGCKQVNLETKCARLEAIATRLKEDRKSHQAELEAMREKHAKELEAEKMRGDERVGKVVDASRRSEDVVLKKSTEVESMNHNLVAQNRDLATQNRELKAEKAGQELLFLTERQTLATTAKLKEAEAKSANDRYADAQKAWDRERVQSADAHVNSLEKVERKNIDLRSENARAVARVDDLKTTIGRLEGVVDQLVAEKQALVSENVVTQSENCKLRFVMKMFACAQRVKRMEMHDLRDKGDAKDEKLAQQQNEVCRLIGELNALKLKQIMDTNKDTGQTRDAADAGVNTEPMQDPHELCDLRAQVGKMHDLAEKRDAELYTALADKTTLELTVSQLNVEIQEQKRQIKKLNKRGVPKDFMPNSEDAMDATKLLRVPTPVTPISPSSPITTTSDNEELPPPPPQQQQQQQHVQMRSSNGVGSVDGSGSPRDATVESLVRHLHDIVNALGETASQAAFHRKNAEAMWAELGVYKQMAHGGWVAQSSRTTGW